MPHDSLRRDLEQIVLYGLRVVREEMDNVRKHNSYVNAVPHAVTLLAEVGNSESSLDAALETLKTTLSDYDEIFGDADAIYLFPALIKLGHNNLPKLESFLYEKGFMNFKKANVLEALVNIAYNWPETRVDVVEILRKFLAKALEDKSDSEITDYYLNGMLVWALADLHPSKLLNMIEQLYREDLVDESIPGSWNDVRKEILSNKQQFHTYELDLKKCYSNALRTFGKQ